MVTVLAECRLDINVRNQAVVDVGVLAVNRRSRDGVLL